MSTVLKQPDQLAFAAPLRSEANLQNRGTASIGQPDLTSTHDPLLPSVLSGFSPITMTYNGTTGQLDLNLPNPLPPGVVISPTSLPITSGQDNALSYTISVTTAGVTEDYTIKQTFSGRPENGDSFTMGFNDKGVSDNRNALKLADLQNKATVGVDKSSPLSTGVSFTDGYGDLVERVGTLTAQARQDSEATTAILKQATDNRDSLSGVNLDEEAANLIKFEQYYNASAQVVQVARSLFDTLISTFR
jgi:flagellar hook-associated protein 1 FlgK